MKGIVLAGGAGTRLHPLTLGVSKQLMPVYDKPMVYYPLSTLMLAGIRDIMIIATLEHVKAFQATLEDGSQWGIDLTYRVQHKPNGLAEAFLIAEKWLDGQSCALVLGDNLFYGDGLTDMLQKVVTRQERRFGATVFGYRVADPSQYGVVVLDKATGAVMSLIEKPTNSVSNWAVIGLYFYDSRVCEFANRLKPSARGELEITDLNNMYLQLGDLRVELLGRGFSWLDTGTHDSLLDAGEFVRLIEKRTGQKIGCIDEIAFRQGFIDANQLMARAEMFRKTQYGAYLRSVIEDE